MIILEYMYFTSPKQCYEMSSVKPGPQWVVRNFTDFELSHSVSIETSDMIGLEMLTDNLSKWSQYHNLLHVFEMPYELSSCMYNISHR